MAPVQKRVDWEGFSSHSIHKYKSPSREYLKRLNEKGLLEEEEPQDFEEGNSQDAEEAAMPQDAAGPEFL